MWNPVFGLPSKSSAPIHSRAVNSAWVLEPCRTSVQAAPDLPFRFWCLPHPLEHQSKGIPDAPAIVAPGRRLYQHVDKRGRTLRTMGIGRHDRVAVVLPNGPEMAVAILTVAASAACAPMNPAYGAEELDRYFGDLRPRALITHAGIDSPARRVALSRGVRVIELSTAFDAEAGLFTLTGDQGVRRLTSRREQRQSSGLRRGGLISDQPSKITHQRNYRRH
jgi:non-ribosomal peptide synthetase component F